MVGMERKRVVGLVPRVKARGARWRAAAGLRKVAVVMFVRVNVRMRFGRVGKRIKFYNITYGRGKSVVRWKGRDSDVDGS